MELTFFDLSLLETHCHPSFVEVLYIYQPVHPCAMKYIVYTEHNSSSICIYSTCIEAYSECTYFSLLRASVFGASNVGSLLDTLGSAFFFSELSMESICIYNDNRFTILQKYIRIYAIYVL